MAKNGMNVGIDLEQSSIAGAQIRGGKSGQTLMAAAVRARPEGLVFEGEVIDVEGLAAELKGFWKAAGFHCTRVTPGGIKRGRDINWYRTDIQPGLFWLPPVEPSERPINLTEYQRLKRASVKMPSRFSRTHY